MTITADQLWLFVATLSVAILSPGPGVIAVCQGAFALGRRRTMPYALGLALGASAWCLVALLGLTAVFRTLPWTYALLKVLGGAYLVWIAWAMWRHAAEPLPDPALNPRGMGLANGVLLNLSNPKPALFYSAVLLSIFPLRLSGMDKLTVYATAAVVEITFYVFLAAVMDLPPLRRGYYAAKPGIDRAAGLAIGILGLSLILRH